MNADPREATSAPSGLLQVEHELQEYKTRAATLARREQQLVDFLENAALPIHTVGPDGCILWANQTELDLLGYTRAEYVGHHIKEFHVDSHIVHGILKRLLAGETLRDQPARLRCKSGGVKHVLIHSNALFENGQFIHTRCFTRDVTAQAQAEESLRERDTMLRLAMRTARMGTWVRNMEDDTVQWSRELEDLFGIEAGSFTGSFAEFTRFVHPDERDAIARTVRSAVEEGRDFHIELRFQHSTGTWRWLEARGQAVYDEARRPLRVYGIAMDITERKRAEETRALAAAILDGSQDAIVSTTLDGCITSWNDGAARLFGYRAEEMIGRSIGTIIPQEAEHEERRLLEKLGAGERVEQYETVRVTKEGRRIDVSLAVSPVQDRPGNVIGTSRVARDITDRRKAENALKDEARALDTLNQIGKAVTAELDLERLVQRVTDAATDLSGAAFGAFFYNVRDQSGGQYRLYTLSGVPRETFALFPAPRNTALFARTFSGEGIVRSDDVLQDPRYGQSAPHHGMPPGHLPVRSYLAVPVIARSGEVIGGLFFGHPEVGRFTERAERLVGGIASQAAIALDNARLYQAAQREIAQRVAAEASLREANQRKDEFLAILAHELRNPLAPIRYAVSIARRSGRTAAQRAKAEEVIERQAAHMARLLDDLLDISRITRGVLELRKARMELTSAISVAIEAARPVLDARHHTLTTDLPQTPLRLEADAVRLAQIFSNLLTNAAKYTDPGGQIQLRAFQDGTDAVVSVRDNGIGIAPEIMPRVFTMFSQAHPALERTEGGLGIGLALVRGLVTLHGGTITARSEGLGRGSEFTVRLPLDRPPESTMTTPPAERLTLGSSLRVVVADDNCDSADSCSTLLALCGHQVQTAHSGLQALELVESFRPHAVLLDIGMPDMNGYEVAERIRARPWGRQITLIAVTGWGQERDRRRAIAAGFDHHLTKPVDPGCLEPLLQGADRD